MPMYEFKCTKCTHTSTKILKVEDRDSPITCSRCGSSSIRVQSLPSPPHFKGQGWTGKFHSTGIDNTK